MGELARQNASSVSELAILSGAKRFIDVSARRLARKSPFSSVLFPNTIVNCRCEDLCKNIPLWTGFWVMLVLLNESRARLGGFKFLM
jgi:hypothetical protein